jgi:hypothetical protein
MVLALQFRATSIDSGNAIPLLGDEGTTSKFSEYASENQRHIMSLSVLYMPYSLDSGARTSTGS